MMKWIAGSLLMIVIQTACLVATIVPAVDEAITLSSPLDYQVSQRQTLTEGELHLQGKCSIDAVKWQYRLQGAKLTGPAENWKDFPSPPKDGEFDFRVDAPAGGWYRFDVRGLSDAKTVGESETVAKASVAHVGVGEVFIIAGQSNAGNYGSRKQVAETGNVASFDGKSWRLANDPQPGAGGRNGSFMPAFGDAMNKQFDVPIGIVAIAAGGTSVRQWLPKGERMQQQPTTGANVMPVDNDQWESTGELFDRFVNRFTALGPRGFRAVLWHQGESDAGQARAGYPADRQITGDQYFEFMSILIGASKKQAGWPVPWFTAQTTYHGETDASDEEFRAAMKKLWDTGLSQEGPDTDTLRIEYRKGVHFNSKGLQKHGQMWADKVGPWLEKQNAPDN